MKTLFSLVTLSLLIHSCFFNPETIPDSKSVFGIWRMAASSNSENPKNSDPLLNEAQNLENVKKGKVLSIFPDNSFTELSGDGDYKYGQWEWIIVGSKICFKTEKGKKIFDFKLKELNSKKNQFELSNKKSKSSFIEETELLENYKEEPFYSENNLWRLKPSKSENSGQIENRLGNFFTHTLYILKAADKKELKVISFEFSMGIIRIYNGAIGIVPLERIPQNWKDTYFNNDELIEAHTLFDNYLQTNKYRGASTGNWVKDDYSILLSIYGDLKSGKFSN